MTNDEWVTGNITLNIKGKPLSMQITVPAKPINPKRMLPIFQSMSNSFVDMSVQAENTLGRKISCQKGCTACCYQLIPVSEIEAYRIADLVEAMPEPRRSQIKQKFENACDRIRETGLLESLEECPSTWQELEKLVMEYFYEKIPCPFLENDSCSIYQDRPMVCSEYLVTSPAENCWQPSAASVKAVNLLVKPSEILRRVGRSKSFRKRKLGFLPMIRSLEWAEENSEKLPEKTGEEWMAEFFTILTQSQIPSNQNKAAVSNLY